MIQYTLESLFSMLTTALETNTMILTTYHSELEQGQKRDLVEAMINSNTQAGIEIMEFENESYPVHISCSPDVSLETQQALAKMVAMAMREPLPDHLVKAVSLLEELKDSTTGSQNESIINVITLLKNGKPVL